MNKGRLELSYGAHKQGRTQVLASACDYASRNPFDKIFKYLILLFNFFT